MPDDGLSDEDKALFRQTMQAVKPLAQTKKVVERITPNISHKPSPKPPLHIKAPHHYHLSSHYQNTVSSETILSYCKQSIPRRRINQLKTGQIPWEARLDLHGFRPNAAEESLCHFIEQQSHLSNRCLLIIHGKGSHDGSPPILKNLVNHWLQQIPLVLAFHSALPRDGGSGALYILLQKQR